METERPVDIVNARTYSDSQSFNRTNLEWKLYKYGRLLLCS